MIDAFAWGLFIAALAAQLALCRLLYLMLRGQLLASELSVRNAGFVFCAVMVLIPWPMSGLAGGLGVYFYTHYDSLRPAGWDVGLIWTTLLLLGFSYFVSLVCTLTVFAKLWAIDPTSHRSSGSAEAQP